MDDYEEGSWTATSDQGTITGTGCRYTKIGSMVFLWGAVNNFSTRTGTEDIELKNLPFTVAEAGYGSCSFYRVANTDDGQVQTLANTNEEIKFLVSSQGGSESWYYLDYEDLNSSDSAIKFSVSYRTTQ